MQGQPTNEQQSMNTNEPTNIDRTAVPQTELEKRLQHIESLSHMLDDKFRIPGTGIKFGYDSIIGLIPGIGDTVSVGLSSYLIYLGKKCGVKKRTLFKMSWNITVDFFIGLIPLIGDIFDVANKANLKNTKLIAAHLEQEVAKQSTYTV